MRTFFMLALAATSLTTPLGAQTPAGAAPSRDPKTAPYDAVDPFIGTGGEGHTFPGASAPFGMVQLSPDTDTSCEIRKCYGHAAGYRYDDPTIQGFSHTHFSGAGHSDLGDILVMPASGATVSLDPGDPARPGSGYRSRFAHATEVAHPGYYAVTLDDAKVRAEMTAGTRIGVHRYTFGAGADAHLVVDLRSSLYNYPGKISWSSLRLMPDGTLTGMRETRGWAPGRKLFFAMRFSAPITDHAFVNREADVPYKGFQGPGRGSDAVAEKLGRALEARLDFGKVAKPLEVRVALSGVDEAGAIANLASEPGDFDTIRAATRSAWDTALGAVTIDAAKPMRTSVYTALYHTLLAPSVWGDADGRFRGPDDQVHMADGYTSIRC
jgi:predicted alpha-1,2-mannosidase